MATSRFDRPGTLALDKRYASVEWAYDEPPQKSAGVLGGVAVVEIRGPLSHHDEWFFDSYDSILERVECAINDGASVILFNGSTPGGEVAGCFATAGIIRRIADEAGVKLVWYVDGMTCSAGLALAMACDYVLLPPEGVFGSIGVIATRVSVLRQAEDAGVDAKLITSGARKADGHELSPITEDETAALQASVDYEAEIFFEWVSGRTGVSVETIRGWQAAIFHGQEAIDLGIADAIADDRSAMAFAVELATKGTVDMPGTKKPDTASAATDQASQAAASTAKKASLDEVRERLGEIAAEDSDEGRRARKMLDEADSDDAEDEEPEREEPEHKEPDGDEGEADDEGDEASAAETDEPSAESEEAEARKAEDEARKADAEADDEARKARAALRGKAKNRAEVADAHLVKSDRAKVRAARYRRDAKQHRVNVALFKTAAKAQAPKLGRRADANAAASAVGARGAAPAVANSREVPKVFAQAAGFVNPAMGIQGLDSDAPVCGICTPEEAGRLYREMQANFTKTYGGIK